jgi:hypothetical protein
MNGFEHPGTLFLIHQEKVRDEIARGRRHRVGRDGVPRPIDRNGPGRVRIALSRGLIALARRIAPADGGLPAGAPH